MEDLSLHILDIAENSIDAAATRIVSLASLVASLALPVGVWLRGGDGSVSGAALLVAVSIAVTHRDNLTRLLAGTEPKFRTRSKGGSGSE